MATDTLSIGTFTFEVDDLPESIPLGGEQMLAVFKYVGGKKDVQSFGGQDTNPTWTGTFNYANAIEKVRILDALYRSGKVQVIKIGPMNDRYGVIKRFAFTYKSIIEIDYDIEIELAPQASLALPTSLVSSSGVSSPDSNSPAAQKTYVVQQGDTLWKVAAKKEIYGDGSQYRKIATANSIANPDVVPVGQKLVIPV